MNERERKKTKRGEEENDGGMEAVCEEAGQQAQTAVRLWELPFLASKSLQYDHSLSNLIPWATVVLNHDTLQV